MAWVSVRHQEKDACLVVGRGFSSAVVVSITVYNKEEGKKIADGVVEECPQGCR